MSSRTASAQKDSCPVGDDECLLDEFDSIRLDLIQKKKHHADALRNVLSGEPQQSLLFGDDVPIPLSSDEKTELAIGISLANVPGAYNSQTGVINARGVAHQRQPSREQELQLAKLRARQKEREVYHRLNLGLAEYKPDSSSPIDDLQARMRESDETATAQIAEADETHSRNKKKAIVAAFVLLIVLVIVGIVVGIVVGINREENHDESSDLSHPSPPPAGSFDIFSNACTVAGIPSQRYKRLRLTIIAQFPNMTTLIDTAQSDQHLALCWLADLDSLQVDDDEGGASNQRFLLALLYFRFIGASRQGVADNSAALSIFQNWLTHKHECDWEYIGCAPDTKEVLLLHMNGLGLTGRIPTELSLLKNLVSIEMTANALTGELPSEIWSMTQLEQLWLNNNQLSGLVFEGVTKLSALTILYIANNRFRGTMPVYWDAPKLEYFDVGNNAIQGKFPAIFTAPNLCTYNNVRWSVMRNLATYSSS